MEFRRFHTQQVSWAWEKTTLAHIRWRVFVEEQKVPADMELDEHDSRCDHLLAYDEHGAAVGTVRLLPDGHIGRLAVLAEFRGQGVGSLLLDDVIALAKAKGFPQVVLHAQTHAVAFYEKRKFHVSGEEFIEAGIPHVPMRRRF